MGINLSSLVQTASGAFEKKRQREIEEQERAQAREMDIMRRQLMRAQITKLQTPEPPTAPRPVTLSPGQSLHSPTGELLTQRTDRPPKPDEPRVSDAQRSAAAMGLNMAQAHLGILNIERRNPRAVQEVARFVRAGRVAEALPIVGPALGEAGRAARAPALSPEARQLMAHINSYMAAAVPERGGKQLTVAEMRLILDEFLVDPGDDPQTQAVKMHNRLKRLEEARFKASGAWEEALSQLGMSDDDIFGQTLDQPTTGTTQRQTPRQSGARRYRPNNPFATP